MSPDFIAGCITGAFSIIAMLVTVGACCKAKQADAQTEELYEHLKRSEP